MFIIKFLLFLSILLLPWAGANLKAQSHEAAVLLLNVEKLNQLREILDKMYDGYRIISQGYEKVRSITSGNFELHDIFLDALYMVSPSVKKYRRVGDIIDYQLRIIKEYKAAFSRFKKSGSFTPEQLEYLANVYDRLFKDSMENLDELLMVITARQLRMSDDERIAAIDRIFNDVSKKLSFLRAFNSQQSLIAVSKAKEQSEIQTLKKLHGLK